MGQVVAGQVAVVPKIRIDPIICRAVQHILGGTTKNFHQYLSDCVNVHPTKSTWLRADDDLLVRRVDPVVLAQADAADELLAAL
jgi:hypothetical protein